MKIKKKLKIDFWSFFFNFFFQRQNGNATLSENKTFTENKIFTESNLFINSCPWLYDSSKV